MIIKEFTFEKKDGTIRTIRGTDDWDSFYALHPELKPKGKRKTPSMLKTIYDLDDDSFKSFLKINFITDKIVGYKTVKLKIWDGDYYHHSGSISHLMKCKTPYFILSFLSNNAMSKNELVMKLSEMSEKIKISKNQKRNVRRLLKAFQSNNLIEQENDKYILTEKGKEFLQNNVI